MVACPQSTLPRAWWYVKREHSPSAQSLFLQCVSTHARTCLITLIGVGLVLLYRPLSAEVPRDGAEAPEAAALR